MDFVLSKIVINSTVGNEVTETHRQNENNLRSLTNTRIHVTAKITHCETNEHGSPPPKKNNT
jgi:hypothetical protein